MANKINDCNISKATNLVVTSPKILLKLISSVEKVLSVFDVFNVIGPYSG